jgi:hypothetical protein
LQINTIVIDRCRIKGVTQDYRAAVGDGTTPTSVGTLLATGEHGIGIYFKLGLMPKCCGILFAAEEATRREE